jgi:cytosine/adenosine deaminase-related metal-dependent hydrolase
MIIANATLANPSHPGQFHERVDVLVRHGRIAAVGFGLAGAPPGDGEDVIDARGGLVLPGLVCAHTHFYGAFARGMALPGEPAADFPHILANLWWRLDKLLTPDDITASAQVFLCDAIRHGTTTLIDHHASPHAIDGSLDLIADATLQAGVRACLCYEVTDRDGAAQSRAGLAENERFARRIQKGQDAAAGMLTASVGLHASFTLSDDSLYWSGRGSWAGLPHPCSRGQERPAGQPVQRRPQGGGTSGRRRRPRSTDHRGALCSHKRS